MVRTNTYRFLTQPTSIAPNGGAFTNSVSVTLSDAATDAVLFYTLNDADYFEYIGPFSVSENGQLAVITVKHGYVLGTNTAQFITIFKPMLNVNLGDGAKSGPAAVP